MAQNRARSACRRAREPFLNDGPEIRDQLPVNRKKQHHANSRPVFPKSFSRRYGRQFYYRTQRQESSLPIPQMRRGPILNKSWWLCFAVFVNLRGIGRNSRQRLFRSSPSIQGCPLVPRGESLIVYLAADG